MTYLISSFARFVLSSQIVADFLLNIKETKLRVYKSVFLAAVVSSELFAHKGWHWKTHFIFLFVHSLYFIFNYCLLNSFIYLSTHPCFHSFTPCSCLSIYLFIYLSNRSLYSSIHPFVHSFLQISTDASTACTCPTILLSINLSIYLPQPMYMCTCRWVQVYMIHLSIDSFINYFLYVHSINLLSTNLALPISTHPFIHSSVLLSINLYT